MHPLAASHLSQLDHDVGVGSRLRRDRSPYPAFRMMNAEPGGGKPSPYTLRNSIAT